MTNSVTFPVALGGDGKTYTDDADPETGLDGLGYTTRLIPMFSAAVGMMVYSSRYFLAINEAKANADRAEDARVYVEAYAGAMKSNILDYYGLQAVVDLDFERGVYRVDNGTVKETPEASEVLTVTRLTPKWVEGPSGVIREVPAHTFAREWRNGVHKGVVNEDGATNRFLYSQDFTNAAWSKQSSARIVTTSVPSPFENVTYQRLESKEDNASGNLILRQTLISPSRSALSIYVKPDQCTYLMLRISGSSDVRVNFNLLTGEFNSLNFNGKILFESMVDGSFRVGIEQDGLVEQNANIEFWARKISSLSTGEAESLSTGDGLYIISAQIETPVISTYIPTTDSSAMRSVDQPGLVVSGIASMKSFSIIASGNYKRNETFADIFQVGRIGANGLQLQAYVDRIRVRFEGATELQLTDSIPENYVIGASYCSKTGVFLFVVNGIKKFSDVLGNFDILDDGTEELSFNAARVFRRDRRLILIPFPLKVAELEEATAL